jgi:2'-5' RNA ligase
MARDGAARPEAKPLRLFVAVDVSDEAKAVVATAAERFRDRIPGARWTHPDGWHVTVKFLGSTWPRLLDEVTSAVAAAAAAAEPFDSAMTVLGAFASPRRARVIWAGMEDPDGRLAAIARDLDARLEDWFVPEKRELTPHLTLARLRTPRDLAEFTPDLAGTSVASEPFRIEELVLYRSHLSPAGAHYEPLERFPFGRYAAADA